MQDCGYAEKNSRALVFSYRVSICVIVVGWMSVVYSTFNVVIAFAYGVLVFGATIYLGYSIYGSIEMAEGKKQAARKTLLFVLLIPVFFAGILIYPLLLIRELRQPPAKY